MSMNFMFFTLYQFAVEKQFRVQHKTSECFEIAPQNYSSYVEMHFQGFASAKQGQKGKGKSHSTLG